MPALIKVKWGELLAIVDVKVLPVHIPDADAEGALFAQKRWQFQFEIDLTLATPVIPIYSENISRVFAFDEEIVVQPKHVKFSL